MEIRLLYRDRDIVLCVKPAGTDAEQELPALLREQLGGEFYCVHRLDKPVGGLMVYARTPRAAAALSRQIAMGELDKRYLAVVEGQPETEAQCRDLLFHDKARNKSYVVKRPRKGVKEARLSYRCLAQREGLSLLDIHLETGRSHQIRVQLASRGLPLAGDARYGSRRRDCGLALWCRALRLRHPVSGERLDASLPPESDIPPWSLFDLSALPDQNTKETPLCAILN